MPTMPRIKVYNGRKYQLGVRYDTKREADRLARNYRSDGYKARVVKSPKGYTPSGYFVYYRYFYDFER